MFFIITPGGRVDTDIKGVEAREAAQYLQHTCHPTVRNYPAPNVNSAGAGNLGLLDNIGMWPNG